MLTSVHTVVILSSKQPAYSNYARTSLPVLSKECWMMSEYGCASRIAGKVYLIEMQHACKSVRGFARSTKLYPLFQPKEAAAFRHSPYGRLLR